LNEGSRKGDSLVLKGRGKIHEPVKGRILIYVPADVHKDSAFPFKSRDSVEIAIVEGKLIVSKPKD
jgi:hypothetical protein